MSATEYDPNDAAGLSYWAIYWLVGTTMNEQRALQIVTGRDPAGRLAAAVKQGVLEKFTGADGGTWYVRRK